MTIQLETYSSAETHAVGREFARHLQPGDLILFTGDLGAGKTQFVQGIAEGLGITDVPISPTFNLVISYEGGRLPLHHFDLYRIETLQQLEDIGFVEYLESDGVCVIEWAERFPSVFEEGITVSIQKTGEEQRLITLDAARPGAIERFEALNDAPFDTCDSSLTMDDHHDDCVRSFGSFVARAADSSSLSHWEDPCSTHSSECAYSSDDSFVLAFDTANEVVAIGLGLLNSATCKVIPVATREIAAHRQSNTTLIPAIDELMQSAHIRREQLACIVVGRGPGSFTGVRIALATAKGIAQARNLPLIGLSTLDAIAWNAQSNGVRGNVLVVADAMRKEVYPVRYELTDGGIQRAESDHVIKAEDFARELQISSDLQILGDGLVKYADLFAQKGSILPERLWEVTGCGLLLQLQDDWQKGLISPFDAQAHDPGFVLPVYTRLSDAEENERARLASKEERDLVSGVQALAQPDETKRHTMHRASSQLAGQGGKFVFRPFKEADAQFVSALESQLMGSDAWNEHLFIDELGRRDRVWWVALYEDALIGYAGALMAGDDLQVLKVGVIPDHQRQGIARELMSRIAEDGRNLGAAACSLEVRASNQKAQSFYHALGFEEIGIRSHYYSDHEDALIMKGPLPVRQHDVGGMEVVHHEPSSCADSFGRGPNEEVAIRGSLALNAPLILAIESSCDETAAALIGGDGTLLTDVVASQIDFHARFGGVVPEIASRKHIEAICGVCQEALEDKAAWSDLDAIAVTYAPGLLGGLVVGVAYGKGAAWALDIPFIGVNHLEGHLYANKLAKADFAPPAVVSLVSGGNTLLIWMHDWGTYEILGSTIDDAVGEAFDKVSKALGLGYPGGPIIGKLAEEGDPTSIDFPRALLHSHDYRFSLSGLKTAVVNYIANERERGHDLNHANIAASFQQAVIDVQVAKARTALRETQAPVFCLGGGVAANAALRRAYERMCEEEGVELIMPPLASCGDNAGMIALVALDRYRQKEFWPLNADALAHADLSEPY